MRYPVIVGLCSATIGASAFAGDADYARESAIPVPDALTFGVELKATHDMLSRRRTPMWVSDADGVEANCGGLDLFEVAQAAEAGPVSVREDMLGSPNFRLKIGDRFRLQFKTAQNRAAYESLFSAGKAVPAYACWCAYGLGHPKVVHLAAPNNAVVTLRPDASGKSGLFFNLRERFESWSANPEGCIEKSEATMAKVIVSLDIETKRPFDRVFDTPPGSRPLPLEPCP